ncbi:speckle-type POZ protein B-like [Planococcus citri]|uniref:speckle-type POZ protein B-like n=1 Tax=Planococcus citri TaxID=170843 RepID=UPI0031F8649C
MILSINKSVLLFPFVCLIFIQHPSSATPITLSKQNDGIQWNADVEFHTIRYNLNINRSVFERDWHRMRENMLPTTENEPCNWKVELGWHKYSDSKISLGLLLVDNGKAGRVIAKFKATLLDDFGREVRSNIKLQELSAGTTERISSENFIELEDITKNPFIKGNTVTIVIEICYYYSRCGSFTDQQNMISPEPNTTKCLLSDNFGSLLENQDFADVMLLAKGKNYSAHKSVLAARSEVFATMFKNIEQGDKKHKKIRIDVTDIDAEVMDELLRYIYTGKCQISDKLAERLYAAADAYKLNELKTISLKSMIETLSVNSAANVLVFADKHHMNDLKSKVFDFIVENSVQVLNTSEWKSVVAPNLQLLGEICQVFSQRLVKSLPGESFCKLILAHKLKLVPSS